MKLLRRLPDHDDLHVYGGIVLLAVAGWLEHIALGFAILGAGLLALGVLYSLEAAKAARSAPRRPETFDAINTASPPADETA